MATIKPVKPEKRERRRLRTPNPEVRKRFLSAGLELINEVGFSAVRIEQIAERASLSVGTFYLYFEGKADLFIEIVIDYTDQLRKRLSDAAADGGSAAERLSRGMDAYFDFVEENERGFLHFRDAGNVETTVGRLSTWALDRHARDLQPLLEESIEEGIIRRDDPELLAQSIIGLMQHVAGFWLEHKETHSRDQVREFVAGFVANALRP